MAYIAKILKTTTCFLRYLGYSQHWMFCQVKVQLGPNLALFWEGFGVQVGSKIRKKLGQMVLKGLGGMLGPKIDQNRYKIDQKIIMYVINVEIDFFRILAPTWTPKPSQNGAKLGPSCLLT